MQGCNAKCVVLSYGCKSHLHESVTDAYDQIGNVKVITLLAHSSHLTQMLDACAFGVVKKKYSSIGYDKRFFSPFTRKLMRIKTAFGRSISQEVIGASWEKTGYYKFNCRSCIILHF